jgi:membrane protease YdiL (CAAX protease family)/catechol 2,3-dioxygenase-like lactoylglutathione lyase family enzyme
MARIGTGKLIEVILYVQDMNLMVSFYRDVLGLDVKEPEAVKDFRDFYWVVFSTGSCSLVLHAGGKQQLGEDAPKIVFQVTDIHTARSTLIERGVELGEVQSPALNVLVCDGRDPEGNAFSLESHTNEAARSMMRVEMPNAPPTYVSVHSKRGLSIVLLRDNKLFIVAELVVIIALICLLPVLKFVSLLALFLLIMALLWLRGNTWSKLGLARPLNWRRPILLGLSFGVFFWLLRSFMIVPIVESFVHASPNLRVFSDIRGQLLYLLAALITSWTSAGFGEEMIFRGYLLNRLADLFGDNFGGWTLALFAQAATFGAMHAYQGLAGMIEVGIYGLLLGLLYLATRRSLWTCAIAHGINDTIAFILTFLL